MKQIYTIIKWKYSGHSWSGNEYKYYDIIGSFPTRKEALNYVKKRFGAKYENGYYVSGENLYTVKKTNYWAYWE